MGAFFNDPEYTARIDRDALANPSPGPVLGAWHQAGLGVMRGGAMAADAVRMAAAVPVVAFGDDETQDAYFAATDEVIKSAVDRWTPDPATTTLAGRVMGGLAEAALPLMAAGGNPALLMASNQTRTSRSLVDQGVDASTARDVGMVDALTIGAGFMIPAVGRTLASKLAFGAVSNPLLNAAGITVQAGALNEADAPQAAAQYDPWDLESRAVDAALGAAFGGMAHAMGAPGGAPPMGPGFDDVGRVFRESVDEILTYRGAQRYESRALGAPTIAARNAHDRAMRTAMEQAIRGEPVAVGAADMPAPPDTPTLDPALIGADMQAHDAPLLADHEYAGLDSPAQQQLLDAAERARTAGVPPEDIQAILELGGMHGYETDGIIKILTEEVGQRGRAAGGAGPAPEPRSGAPAGQGGDAGLANDGKPAGDDIDLELLPQARDLVAAEPDAPIMMVDDLTETTAAQALADADAAIVEAETTYQRAAHAAAGCLLG